MGKPRKPTPNQQAWEHELKRINRFIKNASKRGYNFDTSIIPQKPAKVTRKKIQEIKAIRPETLYKHSTYKDTTTGKEISGEQGRKQERKKSAEKAKQTRLRKAREKFYKDRPDKGDSGSQSIPAITDIVLQNVEEMLDQWSPDSRWSDDLADVKRGDRNLMRSVLRGAINSQSREAVAQRMNEHALEITDIVNSVLYSSGSKYKQSGRDGIQFDIQRFSAIIMGRPLSVDESKDFTDAAETQEDF